MKIDMQTKKEPNFYKSPFKINFTIRNTSVEKSFSAALFPPPHTIINFMV